MKSADPMSLERIFVEVFAIPENRINDSLALRDIPSWDSMSHMMLIARLEETLSVEFTGDEIADFRNVKDIRDALDRRRK
jgi:acyl carrier protein